MRFRDLPIRQKLTSVILITCSAALLLMAGSYIVFEFFSFRKAEERKVSTLAIVIASNSSAALAFQSQDEANEILSALRADKKVTAACLYDSEGNIFARYPKNLNNKSFPVKPDVDGYSFKSGFIEGFQPVNQKDVHLGTLFIKSSLAELYAQIQFNSLVSLVLIVATLFFGFFASTIFQRAISLPIISLQKTARNISEKGDYSIRAVKIGNDELGSLTDAFNHMLEQIEVKNQRITEVNQESSKLAAIVESSGDAIIGISLELTISSWNKAAEIIFGYTSEEMIGEPAYKIFAFHLDDQQNILEMLRSGVQIKPFETQVLTKDNKVLDLSLKISPVKDSDGRLIGISKIARDITELKKNERRIIEKEEHLRLATQSAELGTFDMDLKAGTMMWDPRCRELFGIYHDKEVTYEDSFLTGLHDEDRDRINKLIDEAFDKNLSGGDYDVEYRTVGQTDKKIRWVKAKGKVFFDQDDKPVRFIGSVLDITKQKQDELRKNDFIAIISHELRTPLTTIKSFVQIVLAKAKKNSDEFTIKALTRADSQTSKMSSMISDFLNLTRIEEGKFKLQKQTVDVSTLLNEVVADAQMISSTHPIKLSYCEDSKIEVDSDKISQVLVNLITNAVKYSAAGSLITVGCEKAGEDLKIYVQDKGEGISLKDQEKLFSRFYRVENEKFKTVSGFGIGLYLVSEILKYHDSKIEVNSIEGEGSTFFFYLKDVA
ncbi:MAG: PAS domain S-box protein [Daejeonella sp.]